MLISCLVIECGYFVVKIGELIFVVIIVVIFLLLIDVVVNDNIIFGFDEMIKLDGNVIISV